MGHAFSDPRGNNPCRDIPNWLLQIREISRLRKLHGKGRWRKRKGIAGVRLENGSVYLAEIHWYEASGIGKREFKIKRFIEGF